MLSFAASCMTASQRFAEFTKAMEKRAHLEHLREMRKLDIEERQLRLQEECLRLQQAGVSVAQKQTERNEYGNNAVYMDGAQLCRDIPPNEW